MDGVNGVTQCPIAPGDYFVYNFTATQYGSSWYHSHYSVQYADGAVGPMTLHGPTSTEWDEAISPPLIMTDWGHNTAFAAVTEGLADQDILLNGRGNVTNYNNTIKNETEVQPLYQVVFEGPQKGRFDKKYLMRIINTSFGTTFVFSIDNHMVSQLLGSKFLGTFWEYMSRETSNIQEL
jgi:FtsP/CotA-like multicopper oxidase with cupredoxin domain